jgi:putative membrane protein
MPESPAIESSALPKADLNVYFAAQRTMLAWVRTGIALMGFGFVVARFGLFLRELATARDLKPAHSSDTSLWVGTSLLIAGVIVILIAAYRFNAFARAFRRGHILRSTNIAPELILAASLAVLGVLLAVYLLSVP